MQRPPPSPPEASRSAFVDQRARRLQATTEERVRGGADSHARLRRPLRGSSRIRPRRRKRLLRVDLLARGDRGHRHGRVRRQAASGPGRRRSSGRRGSRRRSRRGSRPSPRALEPARDRGPRTQRAPPTGASPCPSGRGRVTSPQPMIATRAGRPTLRGASATQPTRDQVLQAVSGRLDRRSVDVVELDDQPLHRSGRLGRGDGWRWIDRPAAHRHIDERRVAIRGRRQRDAVLQVQRHDTRRRGSPMTSAGSAPPTTDPEDVDLEVDRSHRRAASRSIGARRRRRASPHRGYG